MFVHIIDVFLNFVQMHNAITLPITIPKRTKLNSIIEYNQEKCFLVDFNTDFKLIFTGCKNKTIKIVKFAVLVTTFLFSFPQFSTVLASSVVSTPISIAVDFKHEFTFLCGVIIYGGLFGNDET